MKPILKYRGGKSKEIALFQEFIPNHFHRYIEPFVGGGALYFHLEPQEAIINDINPSLINFYQGIANNYLQFHEECIEIGQLYAHNRQQFEQLKLQHPNDRVPDVNEELYYHIRDMFNGIIPAEYSYSFLYYFINKTAYSGMIRYNAAGEYNVPYGRYKSFSWDTVTEQHALLIQRTEIHNVDYEQVFELAQPDDFVFLDPPYQCVFSDYGNEMDFTAEDHERLANNFHNLACPTLMVIGSTPLIQELYANNIVGTYEKQYSVNIRNRFHSAAQHLIITNY